MADEAFNLTLLHHSLMDRGLWSGSDLDWAKCLTMWTIAIESSRLHPEKGEIDFVIFPSNQVAKDHFPSFQLTASFDVYGMRGALPENTMLQFVDPRDPQRTSRWLQISLLNFDCFPLLTMLNSNGRYSWPAFGEFRNLPEITYSNGKVNPILPITRFSARWRFTSQPGEEELEKHRAFLDFFIQEVDNFVRDFALSAVKSGHNWQEITHLILQRQHVPEKSVSSIFRFACIRFNAAELEENKPLPSIVQEFANRSPGSSG
jgi:hypothetical protein